jgi:acid phosphatase
MSTPSISEGSNSSADSILHSLYPDYVRIHHVTFIHRHGERAPIHHHFSDPSDWQHQCRQTSSLFYEFALATELIHRSTTSPSHFSSDYNETSSPLAAAAHYRLEYLHRDQDRLATGPNACYIGELTDKGKQTMFELGQQMRRLYIDRLKLLDDYWTQNTPLMARTTEVPRAALSLQALLYGLYPISKRAGMTGSGLSMFTIHAMREKYETMYATSQCARWVALEKRARLQMRHLFSEESHQLKTHPSLKTLFDDGNRPVKTDGSSSSGGSSSHEKQPSLHSILDDFSCRKAHGLPLPDGFDETLFKRLDQVVAREWFGSYLDQKELCRLSLGRFMGQFTQLMLDRIQNRQGPALAVYSGHDSTLAPLLAAWKLFDNTWPPFGSHLAIEIASDSRYPIRTFVPSSFSPSTSPPFPNWFVRVLHQNRPTRLPDCQEAIYAMRPFLEPPFNDGTFCPLDRFLEICHTFIPTHFEHECRQTDI